MSEYPAYLRDVPVEQHVYGTLSYNRKARCWTIKGEPCVTELAKRLYAAGLPCGVRGEEV